MTSIRRARLGDLAAVVEVNRRSAGAAYRHIFDGEPFPLEAVRRRFERLLRSHEHALFLAEDTAAVGFVAASRGLVEALYVVPEAWGTGVGGLLADEAEAVAADDARLWVLEENERGRRFWEQRGWRADGARKVEHGHVELRYRRAASAASWSSTR